MRFAAIALLLGATSAYVVTNDAPKNDAAVAARNVVSGAVSDVAIEARDPHHKVCSKELNLAHYILIAT